MRKISAIFVVLFSAVILSSARQLDSLKRAALDVKLSEYVAAIEAAGPDVQNEEVDFLIGSVSDSLTRQYVALKLYDHYLNSKVMGSESVAIHILDGWFFNGKVKMMNEIDLINARVYADFNRQSLIGSMAPQLSVEDISGNVLNLYEARSDRYSVLYFYDTDCSKCKVETILLRGLLEDEEYPVDLYAFYAGDNLETWRSYVDERLSIDTPNVNVVNIWDPQVESDFQRKYAVLQTPRMYLIRPDGKIVGRGLDTHALAQMLHMLFSDTKLEYGSKESSEFFSQIFAGGTPTQEQVKDVADMIAGSTLHKGDTVMFRQMTGDLLYYLSSERGSGYKEGLAYMIDKYILDPSVRTWHTADDSLKVIGFAQMMDDLLSKSAPGSRIADVKVPGVLLTKRGEHSKDLNLRKLRGRENVIIFHTEGCHVCKSEMMAARKLVQNDGKVKVFMVNIDDMILRFPSLAGRLFDTFDLTSLPYIIITDRKGNILGRYQSLL